MKNKYEYREPDEGTTTFAYLNEHLYQVALRGGYQEELEQVKECLPDLEPFKSAKELMKTTKHDAELREKIVGKLETLWQANYDLRPASGAILMLILKARAPLVNEDYWYDYFVDLAKREMNPATEGSPDSHIGNQSGEMVGAL